MTLLRAGKLLTTALLLLPVTTHADLSSIRCKALLSYASPSEGGATKLSVFEKLTTDVPDFRKFAINQYGNDGFKNSWTASEKTKNLRNERAIRLFHRIQSLGNGFEKLLIDPAMIQHLDAFETFVKNHPSISNPWEARAAFRETTKDVLVYRAMVLTDEELEQISKYGIEANVIRGARHQPGAPHYDISIGTTYSNLIENQIAGWTGSSLFISVSEYPEIAVGVSNQFGKKVHLFEVKAKEIDLVQIGPKNGVWDPVKYQGQNWKSVELTRGNETKAVPLDGRIESLILFHIPVGTFTEIPIRSDMSYRFVK